MPRQASPAKIISNMKRLPQNEAALIHYMGISLEFVAKPQVPGEGV
jgi:hypothetical protein